MGAADRGQIKDKPVTVDLKQLFPGFETFSVDIPPHKLYVFSNTFSVCTSLKCHVPVPVPFLSEHSCLLNTTVKLKAKLEFFDPQEFRQADFFYTFQSCPGYIFG